MAISVGIDLGTTNTVAAAATPTGVEFARGAKDEHIHPSVVSFPAEGGVLVGREARLRRTTDPENTIFSAKRLIGQNMRAPMVQLALTALPFQVEEGPNQQPIVVARDRRLTVPEVSSDVLMYLTRLAQQQYGDDVRDAVITVPANFSDSQRKGTMEAGRLAGLNVLRLINEPTAAALAYGFGKRLDEVVAVFDFGGGTFDVSLLKIRSEIFEVLATDGDFFLGGDDIDQSLAEFLAAEMNRSMGIDPRPYPQAMARLNIAAEAIKKHLSTETEAEGTIDGLIAGDTGDTLSLPFRVNRQQFDNLISGYVERCIEVCRQVLTSSRINPRDISEVICVGGSTRIPLVRERITELFGRPPLIDINPDEVVAQGAAIQAASLTGSYAPTPEPTQRTTLPLGTAAPSAAGATAEPAEVPARPLLLDVTPATLGIATAGGYTERLLEKNAPIPIERTKVFTTAHDNQRHVVIECCRGESKRFDENEPLGTLELGGLPEALRGEVQIEVTFRVDTDGILHVRARDKKSGQKQEVSLNVIGAPTEGARAHS